MFFFSNLFLMVGIMMRWPRFALFAIGVWALYTYWPVIVPPLMGQMLSLAINCVPDNRKEYTQ